MGGVRPPRDWLQRQKRAWIKKAITVNIIVVSILIWFLTKGHY